MGRAAGGDSMQGGDVMVWAIVAAAVVVGVLWLLRRELDRVLEAIWAAAEG